MDNKVLFLRIYGTILIIFFVACLCTFVLLLSSKDQTSSHYIFGIIVTFWYLITGIGVLMRQRWGYYLFKLFLYVLFLAFPVGTFISYKSLVYIKTNNVKDLFYK